MPQQSNERILQTPPHYVALWHVDDSGECQRTPSFRTLTALLHLHRHDCNTLNMDAVCCLLFSKLSLGLYIADT